MELFETLEQMYIKTVVIFKKAEQKRREEENEEKRRDDEHIMNLATNRAEREEGKVQAEIELVAARTAADLAARELPPVPGGHPPHPLPPALRDDGRRYRLQ